jgi:DNA (cytosine-5)-methyltransferase 1
VSTYYNEIDPKAAAWLRELIKAQLIPPGEVDTRSITEILPHELSKYRQQHFFAGIGGWPYALRLAGWPDTRPVRTGSCPCQPFSQGGKRRGEKDERHLWPVFRDLITFGEATVTFGEQVASKLGRQWLARVRADLEALGYGVGAADLCAASVGAPHIRQRLFWVADPDGRDASAKREQRGREQRFEQENGGASRMADAELPERGKKFSQYERDGSDAGRNETTSGIGTRREVGGLGNAKLKGLEGLGRDGDDGDKPGRVDPKPSGPVAAASVAGFWELFELIHCTDGKARRIEPGTFPLAHGVPGRVGLLRGYGNAIVPEVAAQFIRAYLEVTSS